MEKEKRINCASRQPYPKVVFIGDYLDENGGPKSPPEPYWCIVHPETAEYSLEPVDITHYQGFRGKLRLIVLKYLRF